MAKLAVTMLAKDYDHLAPLACGDVVVEDLDIHLDRDTAGAIDRFANDASNAEVFSEFEAVMRG